MAKGQKEEEEDRRESGTCAKNKKPRAIASAGQIRVEPPGGLLINPQSELRKPHFKIQKQFKETDEKMKKLLYHFLQIPGLRRPQRVLQPRPALSDALGDPGDGPLRQGEEGRGGGGAARQRRGLLSRISLARREFGV